MSGNLSEHGLINALFAPLAAPGGLGLLDDAALLKPSPGYEIVMTVDAIVSGVHFLHDDNPGDVACKALGVNLSDLAAKGAEPLGFLLSLGVNDAWSQDWIATFARGLGAVSTQWRCPLYGGDTVRAVGAPFISITALGEVPEGKMVRRNGANVGDYICVSGTIGDAALGLFLARGDEPAWATSLSNADWQLLIMRYHRPQPRIALAPFVRNYATAAMDLSDGLIGDMEKLLKASGVSAEVTLENVPLSQAARNALSNDATCLDTIMCGGDDYEILCTVSPASYTKVVTTAAAAGVEFHRIGTVTEGQETPSYSYNGKPVQFAKPSFSHF
ncbi:thiamine-phosphate kinase [Microvirga sp. W0021]|uniref:Thiamine-monophosphate kinase n=1 Tax=Hohaiivirga grylli TaxID=3133970 RepID=A0ABV0BJ81_9HYPH